ncbi:MAG: hypothetical protein QGG42_04355 [Phycisphaerae bacterium]|jgi:hypothetical protein|nr:hypothetical protein [Phycisphaerae bacterium]
MMKKATYAFLTIALAFACAQAKPKDKPAKAEKSARPPFGGTIFVSGNIITAEDPTAFKSVVAAGRAEVRMFDRRPKKPHKVNAYLFTATFDDGQKMEIRVNPEFGAEGAMAQAKKYLPYIGQMPFALREKVQKVLIHKGKKGFGGGGAGLLIHTDMGDSYIRSRILAETLYHEAAHTSLDRWHSASKGWLAAQEKDARFISGYAKSNPRREDIAESYLLYFALRYKPHRIDDKLKETIRTTMPNRIAYFDSLELKMHPVKPAGALARMSTTELQKELKPSDAQKAKIKALVDKLAAEIKKLLEQKSPQAGIDKLKRQFDKQAVELLNAGQRKTLDRALQTPKPQAPGRPTAGKSK